MKIEQTHEKLKLQSGLSKSRTDGMEVVKRKYGRDAGEEVLVGAVGLECSAPILKLPPAPAGVSARSGRAFRRSLGFPLKLSKNDNKNSVQSALSAVFPFPSLNRSPRPALHRLPLPVARPGLACAAAMISRRVRALYGPVTRNAARHFPLSVICFYIFSLAPGFVWDGLTRIDD